jgi:hypothetical protein
VGDIVSFGSDKPPWRPSRRVILAGLVVVAAAVSIAVIGRDRPDDAAPDDAAPVVAASGPAPAVTGPTCPPPAAAPEPPVRPVAVLIGCAPPGSSLDRRDPTAGRGPWTVVVRRDDGSLGRNSAVVTFPVAAGSPTAPGTRIWPLAGAHARIHGDLPAAALATISARTSVVRGKPVVDPPAGYTATTTGSYRPASIHEIRYPTQSLSENDALSGGLTYTGTVSGGGYDDALLATTVTPAGLVGGRPAVISSVFGGNGALAWEPAPGVIAYIGYSGGQLSDDATAALLRLAARARPLTAQQWQATGPTTVDQTNDPG